MCSRRVVAVQREHSAAQTGSVQPARVQAQPKSFVNPVSSMDKSAGLRSQRLQVRVLCGVPIFSSALVWL